MEEKNAETICRISPSLKVGGIERALAVLANDFLTRDLGRNALSLKDRLSANRIGGQILEFIQST